MNFNILNLKTLKPLLISFALISVNSCNDKAEDEKLVGLTEPLFSSIPTETSKLNFKNPVAQTEKNNHLINTKFIHGAGVAVGDINNDGLQDVFFTGNQVRDRLFINKGDFKFEDISEKAGITTDNKWSTGVTFVDIDNDGDQDIYVCRNVYLETEKSANQLYINNGDLTFTEQAKQFGIADQGFSIQATFFDFDNDGLLDLYLVNQPPSLPNLKGQLNLKKLSDIKFSDRLYKNTGAGRFLDVTNLSGIRNFAFGLSVSVGDFDNDGYQDLYIANDFDAPDHMYINQKNGTFKDVIHQSVKHISNFSMGSDVADYDNDGHLDIMVLDMVAENHKRIKTNMSGMDPEKFYNIVEDGGHYQYMFNTLQRNNGNGAFSEVGQLAGVSNTDWSWTPLFADFDNDGHKDLFVTNGVKSNNRNSDLTGKYKKRLDSLTKVAKEKGYNTEKFINVMKFVDIAPTEKLPNYIFKNNGNLTFSNKGEDWGMTIPTLSNGAAYADFDLDGDLDLVINNIDDNALLYRNNAVEKGTGNYLRFKINPIKNQIIYGTKITLYKENKIWQVNHISNARGYMSKSEDVAHFGVGNINSVEKATIQWQDGSQTTLTDLAVNQVHEISKSNLDTNKENFNQNKNLPFKEVTELLALNHVKHIENTYDDYKHEILLPHKMSQFGPSIAVGDVNGDGNQDFFLGGAAGVSGRLFIQNNKGTFNEVEQGGWTQDKASEDMGMALIDVDGDKDLDLFIVSGGNEFKPNHKALQDRLYINNGKGKFTKSTNALPKYLTSGSCVVPNDFDKDGDLDLFIGGRLVPKKYPHPANSYLLENRNGKYINVSNKKAPDFSNLGMVTSASWFDYNKDGLDDLVVVGEWMPVTIFTQSENGTFEKQILSGLEETEGWYYSVKTSDMDNDGDPDIIVGNLGLNYKYKASSKEPFEVHSYDFDNNGSLDIVLSYYEHGVAFPVRGKSCSTQQIPSLSEKFKTYEAFGDSNLQNIYGPSLKEALNLKAKTFASAYIENEGNNSFNVKPLPNLAQVSSVNNILVNDYNADGHKDLLISGNLYASEIETPRNDAGIGLFLAGNGKGNFTPEPVTKSGFFAPNDAKDMKVITIGGKKVVLVANNNNYLQAIQHN
ncbi:VCBS repeat-containing protein [Gelatiniphilus marinus]|uniref:VCBS repeat-containing protein n=1 Tax=Gelatiniphilus marinus TaxID=1759464 RepID=A0ABW5JQG5_9FLAO